MAKRQLSASLEFGAVEEVEGVEIDRCGAEEEAEEEEKLKKMMVEAPEVKVMEEEAPGSIEEVAGREKLESVPSMAASDCK